MTTISIIAYNKLRRKFGFKKGLAKMYGFTSQMALPELKIIEKFHSDIIEIGHAFLKSDREWREFTIPYDKSKCLIPKYIDDTFNLIEDKDNSKVLIKHKDGTLLGKLLESSVFMEQTYWPYGDFDAIPKIINSEEFNKMVWILPVPGYHLDLFDRKQNKEVADSIKKLYCNTNKGIVYMVGGSLFTQGTVIRKDINYYCDVYQDRKGVERLIDALLEDYLKYIDKVINSFGKYLVALHFLDDFTHQGGPIISPEKYREIFKPRHKKMWDYVHDNSDCKVFYHCCGSVYKLIPDLIDAGMDILHPIQANAKDMNPERLKKEFGKYITFWGGGCDIRTLAYKSPADVTEDVKRRIDILSKGGGFVFAPGGLNILAEVPPENIIAMYETAHNYGFYNK